MYTETGRDMRELRSRWRGGGVRRGGGVGEAGGSDFVFGFSSGMKNQKQSLTPRLPKTKPDPEAASVWLVLNPGESDRDPDRWTRTPEARSYLCHLANVTADIVAMDAFTAAVEAADAVAYSDDFMRGAIHDYERLLGLHLGTYPRVRSQNAVMLH